MERESFNSFEVLKMAQAIEKKGMDYYQHHAAKTDNKDLEKLFLKLKEEEKKHYQKIDEIKEKIGDSNNEDYQYLNDPRVNGYLKTLVEFTIFPDDISKEDMLKTDTIDEIILIAIMAEKESILFYQELLSANEGRSAEIIEKLIEEEKQHLQDLTKISNNYS